MKKIFPLLVINFFFLFVSAQPTPTTNVGIGTTTPTRAKLEVHGSVFSTSGIFGGETTGMSLQSNWPGIGINEYAGNGFRYIVNGYGAVQYLNPNSVYMTFAMLPNGIKDTAAATLNTAMIISNTDNIGIRTTPANVSLYVRKETNFDGSAVFGGSRYNSHFNYRSVEDTYIRGGINGNNVYINDIPGGKVLIGGGSTMIGVNTASPGYTMVIRQVNNKGLVLINPDWGFRGWELKGDPWNADPNNLHTSLALYYNGRSNPLMGWFNANDGSYNANSNMCMKENIETLGPILDKVLRLRPTRYKMRDVKSSEEMIGLIAQEAKLLFPEMVNAVNKQTPSDGALPNQHGINYSGFSIVAIEEQQQQIIDLQKECNCWKSKIKC